LETEREFALAELRRLCEPESTPQLEDTEVEQILDSKLRAHSWLATTYYRAGVSVYPTVRNGRRYVVKIPGISGATEPTSWSTIDGGTVISGGITFEEAGPEFVQLYDMDAAAREAWEKKAAKASRLMKTGGMDMTKIFENCMKMRDMYQTALVG
jgi:hypothetical protein